MIKGNGDSGVPSEEAKAENPLEATAEAKAENPLEATAEAKAENPLEATTEAKAENPLEATTEAKAENPLEATAEASTVDSIVAAAAGAPATTLAKVAARRTESAVEEGALSLTEHLQELRSRMFWSILTWLLGSTVCYAFVPQLMDFTRDRFLNKNVHLIFTKPTEAFIAYLKTAMVAGLFVASPVLLYHIIMFVAPGLKPAEKRWIFRLVPVSVILFGCGCTFAFFVVLPVTMQFFLSFSTAALNPMFQVGDFLGFITGLVLLCGASFQLPLVLFFASLAGLVTSKQLRDGRRYAVFLSALIAAVATPTPDAFTMSVVALPIWILFEISVIVIRISGR